MSSIFSLQRQIKFPFLCIIDSFFGQAKKTSLSDAAESIIPEDLPMLWSTGVDVICIRGVVQNMISISYPPKLI